MSKSVMRRDENDLREPPFMLSTIAQQRRRRKKKGAYLTLKNNLATRYTPPWVDPNQSPSSIRRMEEKRNPIEDARRIRKSESVQEVVGCRWYGQESKSTPAGYACSELNPERNGAHGRGTCDPALSTAAAALSQPRAVLNPTRPRTLRAARSKIKICS
ncbi:hypothetical protein PGT21_021029 [Puccinia graminis f. sp. tritici]|uniref:Uncharacterized protein n=1 Tax=Puccinia graminis f. sp. tritici TaxID=56615 RepID=A0A5B0QIR0_PUCGR|nr:hypothetical protein PGT21_021029 [Puccinia graminis f. sp. tritici]